MVPYFDRAQISKLDIFRYFFRPITDTPIADTPIADTPIADTPIADTK